MLLGLAIFPVKRQETDRVVFSEKAAPVKHPRTSFGMLFLFDDLLRTFTHSSYRKEPMKVVVQDNQIEKAIRDLKKKLTKEGFFSEIKERRFYDKPSVQRKKKQAKAAKRRRKRMRKVY
jgi:small subunit ribosomal protein S21